MSEYRMRTGEHAGASVRTLRNATLQTYADCDCAANNDCHRDAWAAQDELKERKAVTVALTSRGCLTADFALQIDPKLLSYIQDMAEAEHTSVNTLILSKLSDAFPEWDG